MVGNWKMNLTVKESVKLAKKLKQKLKKIKTAEILVCPSFTALDEVKDILKRSSIELGAQDVSYQGKGAFTGEVSPKMLKELNCKYVIIGHSETRKNLCETDEIINKKIKAALEAGLKIILCVGETIKQKKAGSTKKIIKQQIKTGLKGIKNTGITIAYEPVWAISRGNPEHKAATAEDTQKIHAFIRKILTKTYSRKTADKIRIIYGGSIHLDNIKELIAQPDIDGGLVGNASLNAKDFSRIIECC